MSCDDFGAGWRWWTIWREMGVTRVKVGEFGKVLGCLGRAVGRIGIVMLQKGNLGSEAFFMGLAGLAGLAERSDILRSDVSRCPTSSIH